MPRIIRSTGVNVERARPIVAPIKAQAPAPAPEQAQAQADMDALLQAAAAEKQREMEKIHASAEIIVEEILNKARNDADNMLVDARKETVKVLQEAVREGREQGLDEALREMRVLQAAASKEIDEAVESLLEERRQIMRELERDIVGLVFDIAGKVLGVELDRGTEWISAIVKTALQQMEGDEGAVMKVSAGARNRVAEIAEKMLAAAGKAGSLTIVADSSLPPGGCVIDTGKGMIDTGVESKFDRLKTVLRENA